MVERSYTEQEPLVAGHWRPTGSGAGGQDAAAGQAMLVRGLDEAGAAVVLLGGEPLYRAHPKGEYSQVGRALYWTATFGE